MALVDSGSDRCGDHGPLYARHPPRHFPWRRGKGRLVQHQFNPVQPVFASGSVLFNAQVQCRCQNAWAVQARSAWKNNHFILFSPVGLNPSAPLRGHVCPKFCFRGHSLVQWQVHLRSGVCMTRLRSAAVSYNQRRTVIVSI